MSRNVRDNDVDTLSSGTLFKLPVEAVDGVPPGVGPVPLKGALVYDKTTNKVYFADGTVWEPVNDGTVILAGDANGPSNANTVTSIHIPGGVNGQVLALVSGVWTPADPSSLVTLTGDVTGNAGANTVVKLQNRAMLAAAPGVGDALVWNGAAWAPTPGAPVVLGGDVTGPAGANTVVKIQGTSVSAVAPTPNQVLADVAGVWTPSPVTNAMLSNSSITMYGGAVPLGGTLTDHGYSIVEGPFPMLSLPAIYTVTGAGATADSTVNIQMNYQGSGGMGTVDIAGWAHMNFHFHFAFGPSGPTIQIDVNMPALWTSLLVPLAWNGAGSIFPQGDFFGFFNNLGQVQNITVSYPTTDTIRFVLPGIAASISYEASIWLPFYLGTTH